MVRAALPVRSPGVLPETLRGAGRGLWSTQFSGGGDSSGLDPCTTSGSEDERALQLPRHMLILFVALVFSIINPLVPIMSIVYFAVALLTERYNMLYVFTPIFESGGKVSAWAARVCC